jgi:hypothetical protein
VLLYSLASPSSAFVSTLVAASKKASVSLTGGPCYSRIPNRYLYPTTDVKKLLQPAPLVLLALVVGRPKKRFFKTAALDHSAHSSGR